MDYRNADGSVAEMCGNGIRVFARYLVDAGLEPPGRLAVGTRAGVKAVTCCGAGGDVTVDMGAGPAAGDRAQGRGRRTAAGPRSTVDMGNPHAVVVRRRPGRGR